jgi:serine protease Do
MTALLNELENAITGVAGRVGPSVVGLGRGWGHGTGVVVAEDRVLTNAHNARREELTIAFADGRRETGRVGGVDRDLDLAVIEVTTGETPPIEWAPADAAPGLGAPVLALADPGGRGLRVTLGFVSTAERSFRGPRGRRVAGAIEHTAPLPRGSSGGPLVDTDGRLLGINTVRLPGGLILALPTAGSLRERLDALIRGESASPQRLGVAVAPPRVAKRLRRAVGLPERDGVLVRAVAEGSAADRAGLQRGDLIVAAGEHAVDGIDALHGALDETEAGGTLPVTVVRGTEEHELVVAFADAATAEV